MNHYRHSPQLPIPMHELVVDNFAGGGGASTGIEAAIGRPVDIAINHDPDAIAMHMVNHPATKHYCESVWDIDPVEVCNGQPVGLAWFSPDCKHFSKAKGATPVSKEIRGLAWVAVRWAATARPRIIVLENVEEFTTWGPVVAGKPCPERKGKTFLSFVSQLRALEYAVDWKLLRASDYGTPTIRKRLFLVARCDGQPIQWPAPTHGDPSRPGFRKSGLKKWRTAADIIDWSIPCPSIFERSKPLAENTLQRIARGVKRFVLENQKPFIVGLAHGEFSTRAGSRSHDVDEPIRTIHAGGGNFALVTAFLAKHFGGPRAPNGASLESPTPTVTAVDHSALVTAQLLPAPATGTHAQAVRAFLVKYYGNEKDGVQLTEPMHTIPCHDRFGLVTIHGEDYQIVDIGMRMLEPHELFKAQGFPADYVIDIDASGKPVPKYKQVARCGNSVCPPIAAAIVAANFNTNTRASRAA